MGLKGGACLEAGHADASIQAHSLAVEHGVGDHLTGKAGKLRCNAEALGEEGAGLESVTDLGATSRLEGGSHGSAEGARGDGEHTDVLSGQVSGHRQGHGGNTTLAGAVRRLTVLAVEGSHGCDVNDDPPLVVHAIITVLGHPSSTLASNTVCAEKVHTDNEFKHLHVVGLALPVDGESAAADTGLIGRDVMKTEGWRRSKKKEWKRKGVASVWLH